MRRSSLRCAAKNRRDGENQAEVGEVKAKKRKTAERKSIPHLPTETWLQVLAWIARRELGEHVSLACRSLSAVAFIRLHKKCALFPDNNTRKLPYIDIMQGLPRQPIIELDGLEAEWPDVEIPENITTFYKIRLWHFDTKVFAFFKHIKPILHAQPCLHMLMNAGRAKDFAALKRLLPLCGANIFSVAVMRDELALFLAKVPAVLAHCQCVNIWGGGGSTPKLADAHAAELARWMGEPRADGEPKLLNLYQREEMLMNGMKEQFAAATVPSPGVAVMRVSLHDYSAALSTAPFRERNSRTDEHLSIAVEDHSDFSGAFKRIVVTRCAARSAARVRALTDNYDKMLNDGGMIVFRQPL